MGSILGSARLWDWVRRGRNPTRFDFADACVVFVWLPFVPRTATGALSLHCVLVEAAAVVLHVNSVACFDNLVGLVASCCLEMPGNTRVVEFWVDRTLAEKAVELTSCCCYVVVVVVGSMILNCPERPGAGVGGSAV